MVYYELKFNPSQLLSDLSQTAIGRRPTVVGYSGTHTILIEFDPPLTASERNNLVNALPDWVKKLWTTEVKEGSLKTNV